MKTQQLEIKLSNKMEEDIKKARRKSTQAGERGTIAHLPLLGQGSSKEKAGGLGASYQLRLEGGAVEWGAGQVVSRKD